MTYSFPPLDTLLKVVDDSFKTYRVRADMLRPRLSSPCVQVSAKARDKAKEDVGKNMADMTAHEFRELVPLEGLPKAEMLHRARARLNELVGCTLSCACTRHKCCWQVSHHQDVCQSCLLAIETALYVLWRHLDWYFREHPTHVGRRNVCMQCKSALQLLPPRQATVPAPRKLGSVEACQFLSSYCGVLIVTHGTTVTAHEEHAADASQLSSLQSFVRARGACVLPV